MAKGRLVRGSHHICNASAAGGCGTKAQLATADGVRDGRCLSLILRADVVRCETDGCETDRGGSQASSAVTRLTREEGGACGGASPVSSRVTALLASFDAHRHDIEWGGFLTNHLAHGLISLDALGASRSLMERFHGTYVDRLTERRPSSAGSPRLKQSSLRTMPLGRRQHFGPIERAFDQETAGDAPAHLRAVVATHFPRLVDGLAGAAFHALIHLGTGVRMECRSLVTEGLAYLAHSWLPVGGKTAALQGAGVGKMSALECFEAVRREGRLQQRLVDAWPAVSGLPTGYFQRCMHAFAGVDGSEATAAAVAELRACTDRCALPASPEDAGALLLDASLQLYVRSPGNDYFLLHGVTAAFNLCTLLPLLEPAVALRACRQMLMALVATYVAQRCPALCPSEQSPYWPRGDLGAVAWEALRKEALAPDQEVRNEHAYKLCFLCLEERKQLLAQSAGGGSGSGTSERLLHAAARKVLSAPLTGRDGEAPLSVATVPRMSEPESPVSSPHIRSVRSV